jgi:hypothetical protein
MRDFISFRKQRQFFPTAAAFFMPQAYSVFTSCQGSFPVLPRAE